MIAETVHTTGINWASVATIVGCCAAVVGVVGSYIGFRISKWTGRHDVEVTEIKADVRTVQAAAVATNISVARIEGYMAASNGGGTQLPDTVASQRIAEVVAEKGHPTDVVDELETV